LDEGILMLNISFVMVSYFYLYIENSKMFLEEIAEAFGEGRN